MNQDKETIIETSQQKTAAFVLRIVGQFLLFLAVLIAIGIMLHTKINDSINTEVAKFGHHQGQLVSTVYHNLFEGELSQLESAGKLITLGQLPPQNVSKVLGEGIGSSGLVDINGGVISGNAASDLGGAIYVSSGSLTVTTVPSGIFAMLQSSSTFTWIVAEACV